MSSWGRNNIVGYCLTSNSKDGMRIGHMLSPTLTVITSSDVGVPGQPRLGMANMAIGDCQGNCISVNCYNMGEFAIAMDGMLADQERLYQNVLASNMVLLSKSSEELVAHLLEKEATTNTSFPAIIRSFLNKYPGGYSFVIMNQERIYAVRDSYGIKPLVIGRLEESQGLNEFDLEIQQHHSTNKNPNIIASNSVILANLGAKYIREILPGEIVELSVGGVKSVGVCYRKTGDASTMCAMEYIIMEPPCSFLEEQRVHNVRYRLGQALAQENGVQSDCVFTLPNVSLPFVLGYAQVLGINLIEAFYYPSLTTDPKQLSLYPENVDEKVVTLVIDSAINHDLVAALYLLRNSAATKVHLRICSPAIVSACPFGIDVSVNCGQLREVASIAYLSTDSLARTVTRNILDNEVKNVGHCLHCFGEQHFLHKF